MPRKPLPDPLAYLDAPGALVSLAERVASSLARPDDVSFDDAVQDASVCILNWRSKVHTHSPHNFRTPALFYRRVRLDLKKQYERAKSRAGRRRFAEIDERVSRGLARPDALDDPIPALDVSLDVAAAVDRLPPRLRTIVRALFFEGKTQLEVAADLGTNQSAVSQLLTRAKRLLADYLGDAYKNE